MYRARHKVKLLQYTAIGLSLFLAGCSDSDVETKKPEYYENYKVEKLADLVDEGKHDDALFILLERQKLEVSTVEDYQLLLRIRMENLDGIGAEAAIEKLIDAGVDPLELLIPKAKALFLQGDIGAAKKILSAKDMRKEDYTDAYILQGDIAKIQKDNEKAVLYFQLAIDESPDDFRGYAGMALFEFEQGNLDNAKDMSDKAMDLQPEDPIVLYTAGMVARYQGDLETAKKYLLKSAEVRESNIAARLALASIHIDENNVEAAEKQLDIVYAEDETNSMARYYSALIAARKGDFIEANRLLVLTGELTQNYLPAARVYGMVSYELDKCSTAIKPLERFLEAIPGDRTVRLELVECLTKRGMADQAMLKLKPLLDVEEPDQDAYLLQASAMAAKGELRKAIEYFEKAQEISANVPEELAGQRARLIETKIALSRFLSGDIKQSVALLEDLYKKEPQNIDNLMFLANVQLSMNDLDGVKETVSKIRKIEPENNIASNLIGVVYYLQGNLDSAIESYNAALENNSEYASALKNRGLAYLASKQFDNALKDFEAALILLPSDAQVFSSMGRTYLEKGDYRKAAVFLEKAELVLPDAPLILTDYAEALAGDGYTASAITKAKKARALASANAGLSIYLDEKMKEWAKVEADKKAERAKKEAEMKEAVSEKIKLEKEQQERAEAEAAAKLEAEKSEQSASEAP
ncbi:tetratricopeptide repeat protein [Kordiimonas pumila]|uniref:Tetratricopeptide repeat protein n=1 Tax=Kordiimonas pumila TaxID=2161677 RepID=A0ABV7D1B6_9PROT|nr:tetratricopeptide repeat protein [Kordiimonas pumila]